MANEALAQAGSEERIDCRTLADQGIDRAPINYTRSALALENRGVITESGEEMAKRRRRNDIRTKLGDSRLTAGRPTPVPELAENLYPATPINPEITEFELDPDRARLRELICARYRAIQKNTPQLAGGLGWRHVEPERKAKQPRRLY